MTQLAAAAVTRRWGLQAHARLRASVLHLRQAYALAQQAVAAPTSTQLRMTPAHDG